MKTLTRKDFEPLQDPVWLTNLWHDNHVALQPTPFFYDWWCRVAELKFGNRNRWLDAAIDLGYVVRYADNSETLVDFVRFDYDAKLLRESLELQYERPLVIKENKGVKKLWHHLLGERS